MNNKLKQIGYVLMVCSSVTLQGASRDMSWLDYAKSWIWNETARPQALAIMPAVDHMAEIKRLCRFAVENFALQDLDATYHEIMNALKAMWPNASQKQKKNIKDNVEKELKGGILFITGSKSALSGRVNLCLSNCLKNSKIVADNLTHTIALLKVFREYDHMLNVSVEELRVRRYVFKLLSNSDATEFYKRLFAVQYPTFLKMFVSVLATPLNSLEDDCLKVLEQLDKNASDHNIALMKLNAKDEKEKAFCTKIKDYLGFIIQCFFNDVMQKIDDSDDSELQALHMVLSTADAIDMNHKRFSVQGSAFRKKEGRNPAALSEDVDINEYDIVDRDEVANFQGEHRGESASHHQARDEDLAARVNRFSQRRLPGLRFSKQDQQALEDELDELK